MKKRTLAILVILALAVGLLAACGDQAGSGSQSGDTVNLVWMDYNAYNLDEFGAMMAELEEEGIFVELIHMANEYTTQLMIRINAGETPDMFVIEAGLPNILEYDEFSRDLTGAPVLDKILPWAIEDMTHEGKLHGIPGLFNSISLIYNKQLFEQAGITEIPRTYSQLVATAETLQANGITPFSNGYQMGWIISQSAAPFISAEGGTPQEIADRMNSGDLSFQTLSRWNDFLDYLDMTMEFGMPRALETDWDLQQRALALGDAAMIHMGDWAEANIVGNNPDVEIAFIPLPISEDPGESRLYSSLSYTFRVSSATEHPDEALRVIEHAMTSESGLNYWLGVGMPPLKEIPVEIPTQLGKNIVEILAADDTVWGWPYTAWTTEFGNLFGEIMQSYLNGQIAREDVAARLDAAWEQSR